VKKYILVTGATNGIGLETARALASQGHHVLVHGRNPEKGQQVVETLQRETSNTDVHFVAADFASLNDIRRLAGEVIGRVPRLDVLVNNAGGAFFSRSETKDRFEMTFAVNHLAPFLLTNLLLDKLRSSAPARIVTVASAAHRDQQLDFDDLMSTQNYQTMKAYGRSKLANILFTRGLANRLQGTSVTANALHPGVVKTGIGQNNLFARALGRVLLLFVGIPPNEGAKTSIYLASSPEVEGKSGDYYKQCKVSPLRTNPQAYDDDAVEQLWRVSAQLVGLGQA
jgi:NAD(P)-dependent dehydrogenase (short-subunit alcohol dehydrogenase family)